MNSIAIVFYAVEPEPLESSQTGPDSDLLLILSIRRTNGRASTGGWVEETAVKKNSFLAESFCFLQFFCPSRCCQTIALTRGPSKCG